MLEVLAEEREACASKKRGLYMRSMGGLAYSTFSLYIPEKMKKQ